MRINTLSGTSAGVSEIIATGKARHLAEIAFGIEHNSVSRFMPGVFSGKKQIVPSLMNAVD